MPQQKRSTCLICMPEKKKKKKKCAIWITKDANFLRADNENWSDCMNAQANLSLRLAQMSEDTVLHSRDDSVNIPASILRKSTSGRHRPVSYPDGPMTVRYRFT